jgi:hypothetical protein
VLPDDAPLSFARFSGDLARLMPQGVTERDSFCATTLMMVHCERRCFHVQELWTKPRPVQVSYDIDVCIVKAKKAADITAKCA